MSLVKSNRHRNQKENKNKLDRGKAIVPQHTFSLDDIPKKEEETIDVYIPKATSLRFDTRIRDQVNALSLIGYGRTQKEVLETMINIILESMTPDEKRKFDFQYQVLENKTIQDLKKSK